MSTVGELRALLTSKGYSTASSSTNDLIIAPLITVHTHPLLNSPIALIGTDTDTALSYQETAVTEGLRRR